MRRFIYLDTETLNSYLAQIFDGLIQNQETETSKDKKIERQRRFSTTIAGQIAFKLFGKGVDTTADATLEHLKTVADDEMVRDVQSKIMHDNAFNQFMEYLQENNLILGANIGDFVSIEDDFYIFDIQFYQKLFGENGFVSSLESIQRSNTKKTAEAQFEGLSRDQRRSKSVRDKIDEIVKESTDKTHEEYYAAKNMIDMLASIIPYPQILCISNYVVVLNEKYLRDDISTAAFKYGGRIRVVGYITNQVASKANSAVAVFSGIGNSINALMKIFFENADDMYIVHPVAIFYES